MAFIDDFLNRVTMYRLALYVLTGLFAAAAFLSLAGALPYPFGNLAFSLVLILALCTAANYAFAKWLTVATNVESVYITAFILALVIAPVAPTDSLGVGFIALASVAAIASKYLLVYRKKHIFNPAAFGLALPALLIGQSATWWTDANPALLTLVVLGGLLIIRKLKRSDLVLSFFAAVLLMAALTTPSGDWSGAMIRTLQYSSFYFFAFVMLTEPLTTPVGRRFRVAYGALVGLLYASNIHVGPLYFSLEVALLAGNLFSFVVSPKGRFILKLVEKKEVAANTLDFAFTPDRPLSFRPGQYLKWTLPHSGSDSRGNRRSLTIASAPTEKVVRIGVRVSSPGSSFKRALASMRPGDTISATSLAGSFTLPDDPATKLAFIAGGIGITPFRSMVRYLTDTGEKRDIVLLYSNKTAADIAYREVFDEAREKVGLKIVYALTAEPNPPPGSHNGPIDAALIKKEVPDYHERVWYLSGPRAMVGAFEKLLGEMGVARADIKTDYFPGYA